MNLAIFDFDGTISNRDSFLMFVRKVVGRVRFSIGMAVLSPYIIGYLFRCYPNYRLKEDVLTHFFSNHSLSTLKDKASCFARDTLPEVIRPQAMRRIDWHMSQGDRVVVVTATPDLILKPWCDDHGFELLATRLEVADCRLTGRIEGRNCWGDEKVRRLVDAYELGDYADIFVYGDSRGDLPMLELATQPFYKPFRNRSSGMQNVT